MQDTEQRGWVTLHHRSLRLACCKPGGRAIFFSQLVSYGGGGGGWEEEQIAVLGLKKDGELERSRRHGRGNPTGTFAPEQPKLLILSRWTQQSLTKLLQHSLQTVRSRRAKRPGYMVTGCPDTKYPPCLSLFKYHPFHGCNCIFNRNIYANTEIISLL